MCKEMRESGIEWIGDIPREWDIRPLKAILKERNEKNIPIKSENILSLTIDRGVIPYKEKNSGGNKAKEDLTAYKLTYPNDIVINSMNVIAGSVGLSSYFGCISPVYYTLYTRRNNDNIKYFNYIFQSKVFQLSLLGLGNGIMMKQAEGSGKLNTIRMRIPMQKLNALLLPYPSIKEQEVIANYLDKKVSQIDGIISKQRSLIEKYKAYKQSLITETVIKGLDKNVPMKDSGIEWIGEIPSHWEIKSMKYLCSCNDDSLTNSEDENMCINYVDISSVTFESGIVNYEEMLFKNAPSRARRVTQYGDIIISTVRTYLKAIAIIPDDKRYIVSTGFAVIRAKYILNRYLDYFVKSEYFINLVSLYSKGISYPAIDSFDLMNIKIVEPSIDEQEKIADFLDKKCNAINLAIAKKEQLIEKLESYKNSLIYEYVTGKREVM